MIKIKPYTEGDKFELFSFLRGEGNTWSCYYNYEAEYSQVLADCIVYVALINSRIVGYIRCRKHGIFDLYVYDLLVAKDWRGRGLGKSLIETAAAVVDQPRTDIYMLSDEDGYYEKQRFEHIGSIFRFTTENKNQVSYSNLI